MYINPSDLSSTELKSIVALHKHNKPILISSGFVITKDISINWRVINNLCEK